MIPLLRTVESTRSNVVVAIALEAGRGAVVRCQAGRRIGDIINGTAPAALRNALCLGHPGSSVATPFRPARTAGASSVSARAV
jgi:hypothetical protein